MRVCVAVCAYYLWGLRVYMHVQCRVRSDRWPSQEPLADAKSGLMELELRACDGITVCTRPNVNRQPSKTCCPNPRHGLFEDLIWGEQTLTSVQESANSTFVPLADGAHIRPSRFFLSALKKHSYGCRSTGSGEVLMEAETKPAGAEPLGGDAPGDDAEVHTDAATQDSSISNGDDADGQQETVDLKIIWNKNKYDLKIPIDDTGAKLKESIHSLTGKERRGLRRVVSLARAELLRQRAPVSSCRSSTGHAEGHVQRSAPRGQDATRNQGHQRCQNHGGGIHDKRRVGGEHAQRGHPAGSEGRGEQEGAAVQAKGATNCVSITVLRSSCVPNLCVCFVFLSNTEKSWTKVNQTI